MKNKLTQYFLVIGTVAMTLPLEAQSSIQRCGTLGTDHPIFVDVENIQSNPRSMATIPEVVEVFVHHVTCTGCGIPADEPDTLLARLNDARAYFSPHDICFLLVGSQIIYDSDLAEQFVETEEGELTPFLKPGVLNVFIHRILHQPGGINGGGNAYNIPNYYLSVENTALSAECCEGLLAHEIGHCLGLYHTHENWQGTKIENVDRTGSCKNCDTDGDLLCDTPADPGLDIAGNVDNCNYTGVAYDPCNEQYDADATNIMSYAPDSCQFQFSTGQGVRALNILNTTLPTLKAPTTLLINLSGQYIAGEFIHTAKTTIDYSSADLTYAADAVVWSAAGQSITVSPGTAFSTVNGSVRLSVQNVCE